MTAMRELAERWKDDGDLLVRECGDALSAILDAEGDGGAVEDNAQCSHCGAIFTRRDWTADNFDRPIPRCQFCGSSGAPQPVRTTETHPARSGVVSDEECREFLCKMPISAAHTPIEMVRAALTHFAKGTEVGGDVEDAARYRWLRDNCQPGANNNDKPHALVKVCVGTVDNRVGWFSLIGSKAHVGIVTLDQAIDAARKGERHD